VSGTVISGRYELGDRLGSGGMSSVYRATDRVLERTVAVKILAEHLSDDEKFVARFRREALAVAQLIHPNIVQVYDTGVDAHRHYIVMEYVEGKSGAQLLQTRGRLGPEVSAAVGVQACAGLEYAHRQGIIHRDVKPGNLMVIGGPAARGGGAPHDPPTGEMTVKLTDFGIARAAEQTRLTQVGSVVGTAAYLAPEQARGDEAGPPADVYALGVVIYQLLTGRLPWEGSTLAELTSRRETERPLPPTSYDSSVPQTLSTAVLRALESEVDDRYTSARELSQALRAGMTGREPAEAAATQRLAADEPATRRLAPSEPLTPVATPRAPARAPAAPPPARRSGGSRLASAVGLLLLIAVVAAVIAGVVLLITDAGQDTDLGQRIEDSADNVDQLAQELEDIIRENSP
jgi:eukaryotic-like serine/threonine-protein kinase